MTGAGGWSWCVQVRQPAPLALQASREGACTRGHGGRHTMVMMCGAQRQFHIPHDGWVRLGVTCPGWLAGCWQDAAGSIRGRQMPLLQEGLGRPKQDGCILDTIPCRSHLAVPTNLPTDQIAAWRCQGVGLTLGLEL